MTQPDRVRFAATMDLITTTDELAAVCSRMARHPFVTVDTEFLRETTYYPLLCVAQMASPAEAVVIDALATGIDLAPFFALMANEKIVKVFHAAHQDIEHRRERRAGRDFFQHSFLVGERVQCASALRDVAEAPYTTNISLFDQLNCRILLEDTAVFQLQDIESLRCGRGDNFLDARQIPGRFF